MWAITYVTYNAFSQTEFMSRKREAKIIAESLGKLKHVSNVLYSKIPNELKKQMDADLSKVKLELEA